MNMVVFYKETKSKGAFHLSELTGQPVPLVMRISLLIKLTIHISQILNIMHKGDKINKIQKKNKGDGFSAKPFSLLKCLVLPWSDQLVLTFGKRP